LVLLENEPLEQETRFLPLSETDTVCFAGIKVWEAQVGGWTLGWQKHSAAPIGETVYEALSRRLGAKVVSSGCSVGVRVVGERAPPSMNGYSYAEGGGDNGDPSHDNGGSCTASKGCVVVILGGRPVNVEKMMNEPLTKAVVMAWYPGTEGAGVVDVLYGSDEQGKAATFSGRLPMTWPVDSLNTPINWCDPDGEDGDDNDVADECEDGMVYGAANPRRDKVLFPMGFGLTYQ
jgi:beta-glucosidase